MFRGARRRGLAAAVLPLLIGACSRGAEANPQLVIGVATTTAAAGPGATIVGGPELRAQAEAAAADPGPLIDMTQRPRRESPPAPGLKRPDGRPYGEPIVFRSSTPVPSELFFVIVVGSDARPNEDVRRANGDAVHVIAVNPRSGQGTIVDIPRDAWVEIPGRGNGKLSSALQGGPDVEVKTLRKLTGLPINHYVITGFTGMARMVDDLGGVDVYVDRRMNDPYSGARFEPGWHHFNGQQALAFSRNRYDTPYGDFSRTENQGKLILATLAKLRSDVGDETALNRWVDVLMRNVHLDMPLSEVRRVGTVAARLDPKQVRNVVAPGRVGSADGQAVVFLGAEAAAIFNDLRDDAVVGKAGPATTTTTEPPPTTTSTAVAQTTTSVPQVFGTTSTTSNPSSTTTTRSGSTSSTTGTTEPGDSPDR